MRKINRKRNTNSKPGDTDCLFGKAGWRYSNSGRKDMKRFVLLLSLLGAALMLAGCAGMLTSATVIPYTGDVPAEKLCTLNIASTITVQTLDGKPVTWKPEGFFDSWVQVRVPAGTHVFTFRLSPDKLRPRTPRSMDYRSINQASDVLVQFPGRTRVFDHDRACELFPSFYRGWPWPADGSPRS